jgi:hypothetical protein
MVEAQRFRVIPEKTELSYIFTERTWKEAIYLKVQVFHWMQNLDSGTLCF